MNILHRNLNLENIVMDEDGYIKVINYGLAKKLTSDPMSSISIVGNIDYLAPEVLSG